jgi:GYF domain 2
LASSLLLDETLRLTGQYLLYYHEGIILTSTLFTTIQIFMNSFLNLLILFLIGTTTAYFANQKRRDPYIWFAIGILLGIFGFLLLLFLPPIEDKQKPAQDQKEKSDGTLTIEAAPDTSQPPHDYLIKDWFYIDTSKQQAGPVNFDLLKPLWKEQKIGALTFVWAEGMQEWKKIQDIPTLLRALNLPAT